MYSSFIIGFHTNRMDNLLQTIRFLEEYHLDVISNSQLILLCQDTCDPIQTKFKYQKHFNLNLKYMRLPYVTNMGVENADSEKIIILESDRIVPAGYFKNAINSMKPGIIISPKKIIKLSEYVNDDMVKTLIANVHNREDSLTHECIRHYEERSDINEMYQKNVFSGNTAIMKSDYINSGKMDEKYIGHGWADNDMTNTVLKFGIEIKWITNIVEVHLYHDPLTYSTVDLGDSFLENGLYYCNKWKIRKPAPLIKKLEQKKKMMLI